MNRKVKWIAVLVGLVVFLSFGSLLPGEPLAQRSMVVGFGVDMAGEESIKVSAQILNPSGDQNQSGTETNVVTATDYTIAGALHKISEKSSHSVALTHCNVVFIGRSVAESKNIYSIINYLMSNSYLSENAFLFLSDDAEDVLSSKTGFGDNASLYAQSIVGLYGDYSDIAQRTLKCFVVGFHSLGKSTYLPVIKKESTPPTMGGQKEEEDSYLFDMNTIATFRGNEYVGDYEKNDSRALNYVNGKLKKGAIEATGDHGEKIVLYLTGNEVKKEFLFDKKLVKIDISLKSILKEIIDYSDNDEYIDRTELTESEIKNTEKNIADGIKEFFRRTKEKDLDLYNFLESFYSKEGKKAENLSIKDINIEVKVSLSVDS